MTNRMHIKLKYKNISPALTFLERFGYKFYSSEAALVAMFDADLETDAVIYLTTQEGPDGKALTWNLQQPTIPGTLVKWKAIKAIGQMGMLKTELSA